MCAGGDEAGPAGRDVEKAGSGGANVEGCRAKTRSPPRIHKLEKTSLCRHTM